MEKSRDGSSFLCTLRELTDNSASIMETINTENIPVIVTRMGRFIAIIWPLANIENLEGKAISAAVEAGLIDLDSKIDKIYTSDEIREALALNDDSTA